MIKLIERFDITLTVLTGPLNSNLNKTLRTGTDRSEQTVYSDQTPQNAAFDQNLHCHSSSIVFDISTCGKRDLFKLKDKYGKELRCPNI